MTLNDKINKVGKLNDKINKLKKELKPLQDELNEVSNGLLNEVKDSVNTNNYMFVITSKGYERTNKSYKDGFLKSLDKVNSNTRKVLENELKKTENVSYIKPKFKIVNLKGE